MKLYRVNDNYVNYLKTFDSKVQDNYKGKRAYVGIILTIDIHQYFAPLSSYKASQEKIKRNDTVFKLHARNNEEDKLGLIHINNMIPILTSEIQEINFKEERKDYAILLRKQYQFILSNVDDINNQTQRLYKRVVEKNDPFHTRLSCNFKLLEKEYINFNK